MTWVEFVDNNETKFRREFGIENDETGEREVFGWICYEAIPPKDQKWEHEAVMWELRAIGACLQEAAKRNARLTVDETNNA